ncbi:hypothetical protein V8G54_027523 [Vigna mungo]|uniref:Uncharacterized protein n=1 Tax=Vigna mungo TaxID=3915 RepID=A0AAQ3N218_VIGMU
MSSEAPPLTLLQSSTKLLQPNSEPLVLAPVIKLLLRLQLYHLTKAIVSDKFIAGVNPSYPPFNQIRRKPIPVLADQTRRRHRLLLRFRYVLRFHFPHILRMLGRHHFI